MPVHACALYQSVCGHALLPMRLYLLTTCMRSLPVIYMRGCTMRLHFLRTHALQARFEERVALVVIVIVVVAHVEQRVAAALRAWPGQL